MHPRELLARRCHAQLLSGPPATDPVAVAEQLLAVQGQDPRGFRLAVRSRTTGLCAADVDRALTIDRTLVVTTLNRGTLHLVRPADYWWLHAVTTPRLLAAATKRLASHGISADQAERGVKAVVAGLAADGPLVREQLGARRIAPAGLPTEGQSLMHLLFLMAVRGLTVRGPMQGGQQAIALVADWLGPAPHVDREDALDFLARRYLVGHGPAAAADLARWGGITLGQARAGMAAIANELVDVGGGLADVARPEGPTPPLPAPRLLGSFDPVLLGWRDRTPIVGANQTLVTNNGIFHPFAFVDGRAVATWGLAANTLTIRPWKPIPVRARHSLADDAGAIGAYLGLDRAPTVVFAE